MPEHCLQLPEVVAQMLLMYQVLQQRLLSVDSAELVDSVSWKIDKAIGFSVANCHQYINVQSIPFGPHDRFDKTFKLV